MLAFPKQERPESCQLSVFVSIVPIPHLFPCDYCGLSWRDECIVSMFLHWSSCIEKSPLRAMR